MGNSKMNTSKSDLEWLFYWFIINVMVTGNMEKGFLLEQRGFATYYV